MAYKLEVQEIHPNEYVILKLDILDRFTNQDSQAVLVTIKQELDKYNIPMYVISGPWKSVGSFNVFQLYNVSKEVFSHPKFIRAYAWGTIGLAGFFGDMLNKMVNKKIYKGGYVSRELAYEAVRSDIISQIVV